MKLPNKKHGHGGEGEEDSFAIVFAAMGVNMETAHFFKQVKAGPSIREWDN